MPDLDLTTLRDDPEFDASSWGYDDITVEPDSITLHDSHHGTWKISGFRSTHDAIMFMRTGDHHPGTKGYPNEYELVTRHKLSWKRM